MGYRRARWAAATAVLTITLLSSGRTLAQPANPCDTALARDIPARSVNAPTGSEFTRHVMDMNSDAREAAIRDELLTGNVPAFLRQLQPVTLTGTDAAGARISITACVFPDYLAIGSNEDFLLTPMRLETALSVAARYGFILPTPKMVDAIYAQATFRLPPQPLPASAAMRSTDYYRRHDQLIRGQRERMKTNAGNLISGHKKDLVFTNRLWTRLERVAIYGWHRASGAPIQPLSTVHGWRYADYSHGARLVSTEVFVNGVPRSIYSVMQDPQLASILNDEGAIRGTTELIKLLTRRVEHATAESSI